MKTIQIRDKHFTPFIPEIDILSQVDRVAREIDRDMQGRNPLFLSVLNGAFMFTADLMKRITIPCEIAFIRLASYQGTGSTGHVKQVLGLNQEVRGRTIVVVEDIVDTGMTMKHLLAHLRSLGAQDLHVAALLVKPDKLQVDLRIDYTAMQIPNDFIVGYGLDYDGYGRNLRDIYTVVQAPDGQNEQTF